VPKSLRLIFTASAFLAFFMTGGLLGRLLLPIVMALPGSPERRRARREGFFLWANRVFVGYMRALRLIYFERPPLPPDLPPSGQAYVVIANHPSLIDTLLLGATLPGLTMVAKASWYRSWLLGPLLKHGGHVRGPEPRALAEAGASDMSEETGSDRPVLARMVAQLRAGRPLLVFPEGSRSPERALRRFRRGALEAAIEAGVPILPAFIAVAPPMLMKHQKWHDIPQRGGRFTLEFFPLIPTAGRELDARALNKQLRERFEARHQQMLRDRDALAAPPQPAALPGA